VPSGDNWGPIRMPVRIDTPPRFRGYVGKQELTSIVSGRNGFNIIDDQTGTVMVTVANVPDAPLHVGLVPAVTLAELIAPVSTHWFVNVTAYAATPPLH